MIKKYLTLLILSGVLLAGCSDSQAEEEPTVSDEEMASEFTPAEEDVTEVVEETTDVEEELEEGITEESIEKITIDVQITDASDVDFLRVQPATTERKENFSALNDMAIQIDEHIKDKINNNDKYEVESQITDVMSETLLMQSNEWVTENIYEYVAIGVVSKDNGILIDDNGTDPKQQAVDSPYVTILHEDNEQFAFLYTWSLRDVSEEETEEIKELFTDMLTDEEAIAIFDEHLN